MLIIIKSSPETAEAKRGFQTAKDLSANVLLMQNAVYALKQGGLDGVKADVYAMEDDMKLRGIKYPASGVKPIDWAGFVDLAAKDEKTLGMF